jgi:hypothetical protein
MNVPSEPARLLAADGGVPRWGQGERVLFVLIVMIAAACGTTSRYLTPSGSVTTLMPGWERHFTLDWTVEPGGVGGFGHTYFEVPHLAPADKYRVTVWDYTFVQSEGDKR